MEEEEEEEEEQEVEEEEEKEEVGRGNTKANLKSGCRAHFQPRLRRLFSNCTAYCQPPINQTKVGQTRKREI